MIDAPSCTVVAQHFKKILWKKNTKRVSITNLIIILYLEQNYKFVLRITAPKRTKSILSLSCANEIHLLVSTSHAIQHLSFVE